MSCLIKDVAATDGKIDRFDQRLAGRDQSLVSRQRKEQGVGINRYFAKILDVSEQVAKRSISMISIRVQTRGKNGCIFRPFKL